MIYSAVPRKNLPMLSTGDLIVVDAEDSRTGSVIVVSYTNDAVNPYALCVSGCVPRGARGVVLGVTSKVQGEDRFVRVLFSDKISYVSEKFIKKVDHQ